MSGPAIWTGFMILVLIVWTVWLRSDYLHPDSEARATKSLIFVIAVAVFSLLAVLLIF